MADTLTKNEHGEYVGEPDSTHYVASYVRFNSTMHLETLDVRRISGWDGKPDEKDAGQVMVAHDLGLKIEALPPPTPARTIVAKVPFLSKPNIGTIDEKGAVFGWGAPEIEIHEGLPELSCWRHHKGYKDSDGKEEPPVLYLVIYVPKERMDWLWHELGARPGARFELQLQANLYVSKADLAVGPSFFNMTSYIEPGSTVPLDYVSFFVMDPKPFVPPPPEPPPEPMPAPPPAETTTDKLLRQMLNLQAWGLGAVLVAVLFGVGRCDGVGN